MAKSERARRANQSTGRTVTGPFTRILLLVVIGVTTCIAACRKSDAPANRSGDPEHVGTAVIIIHGVGNQTAGYSKPMQDLLKAQDPALHFVEVLWSDLGSVIRRTQDPALEQEREAAEQELVGEIDAAEQRAIVSRRATPSAPQSEAQIREEYAAARGYVSPIVSYEFLSVAERGRIQQRFRDALAWTAQHADRTYVIAHSLGTVIAFDTLHGWESSAPSGKVAFLSTMGSPLGKRIFAGHRGRPTGRPGSVDAWENFYSPNDLIASPLTGAYLNVEDRRVKTPVLPLAAHRAYWTHADVVGEVLKRMR